MIHNDGRLKAILLVHLLPSGMYPTDYWAVLPRFTSVSIRYGGAAIQVLPLRWCLKLGGLLRSHYRSWNSALIFSAAMRSKSRGTEIFPARNPSRRAGCLVRDSLKEVAGALVFLSDAD